MRAIETSKVLSWRWAPCVALVLGACCFSAFAMLVIPERIGGAGPSPASAAFRLEGGLASIQSGADGSSRLSNSDSSSTSTTFSSLPSNQGASRSAANLFPKRGFTPPLERPDPPPAPPPVVPPQPTLEVAPPPVVPVVPPQEAQPPQAPPPQAPSDPQAAAALAEQGLRNAPE
ncbi:MAG: hypothetical protein EOO73_30765 [Myxococcales bacterium]|nr:MAG: hypothetical protein EOO73_30765 [Myxococcales bacterium]